MITEFLKTTTESEMMDALAASGVIRIVGSGSSRTAYSTPDAYIDIIGQIDGVDGFHANILCVNVSEESRSALPFIDPPATPERLFA